MIHDGFPVSRTGVRAQIRSRIQTQYLRTCVHARKRALRHAYNTGLDARVTRMSPLAASVFHASNPELAAQPKRGGPAAPSTTPLCWRCPQGGGGVSFRDHPV